MRDAATSTSWVTCLQHLLSLFFFLYFSAKKHQMSFWAPWTVWPNLKHTATVTGSQTAGRKPRAISRCKPFFTCACAFVVSLGNCGNNVHMACSNLIVLIVFHNFRAVVGFRWRCPDIFCQGGDEANSRGEGMQDARELATREGILIICIVIRINMGLYQITMILLRIIIMICIRLCVLAFKIQSERFKKLNLWPWLKGSSPHEALHIRASLSSRPSSGLFEGEELMPTQTPRRLLFLADLVHLLFFSFFYL